MFYVLSICMVNRWSEKVISRGSFAPEDATGCSEKMSFFHNSLQPLPRLHRCVRPSKLSKQCECTVSPTGWSFFAQPIAAECWRGRGDNFREFLKKTQYLMNTL